MTDNPALFCESCGAQLAGGANFCEHCGHPVKRASGTQVPDPEPLPPLAPPPAPARTQAYEPPLPYTPPPAAASSDKKTLPVILGVVGCLGLTCIGLLVLGGVLFFRNTLAVAPTPRVIPPVPTQARQPTLPVAQPTLSPLATLTPLATLAPLSTQSAPEVLVWPADVEQTLTEDYFSDNFSDNRYDWADVTNNERFWGFEEGHYGFHLFEPDYSIWAYLPVTFTPATIGFDAAVQPGFEQGGYGVLCHYQDEDNFHFVSVDPWNREYSIGYVLNGEYETLLSEMWMPSQRLNQSAHAVNSLMVSCEADVITLFINNELEAQAELGARVEGGDVAVFGETWEDTPAAGFKVWIDNLYAFVPRQ
jgi:hypothetical protein